MACSFNTEVSNADFTIEYVIPNLILQWVSKEKTQVSGLTYLSTKTSKLRNSDLGLNFVFPPKTKNNQKGFCNELIDIFTWSKPISWQLLDTTQNRSHNNFTSLRPSDNFEKLIMRKYKATKFFEMETQLQHLARLGNNV